MMRLIDADALIEAMTKFSNATGEDMTHGIFYAHIAPTVEAVPQWIPCSERMPQWWWINPEADEKERIWDGEKVIVCGTIGNWPYSGVACGMYGPDGWSIEDDAFSDDDVPVAWMPLPKPYEVEDEKTD